MFNFYPIQLKTDSPKFILSVFIKLAFIIGLLFPILSRVVTAENIFPQEEILFQQEKMLGDFDEMVKHRTIRALVTYSKTFYFIDRGR